MIRTLDKICTILKPTFDDNGRIIFEDFGDYFCAIDKNPEGDRFLSDFITHKAKMIINGVIPGDILITAQHNYTIISIDKKKEILGLMVIK